MDSFIKLPVATKVPDLVGFVALVVISIAIAKRLPVVSKLV